MAYIIMLVLPSSKGGNDGLGEAGEELGKLQKILRHGLLA